MPAALFPPVGSPSLHVDSPLCACDQPRTRAVDEESLPPGVRCVGAPATTLTVATFAVAVVSEGLVFRHYAAVMQGLPDRVQGFHTLCPQGVVRCPDPLLIHQRAGLVFPESALQDNYPAPGIRTQGATA